MVYKYKVKQNLSEEDLHSLLEEKKSEVLNENPNFSYIGSSVVQEGEDELNGLETLLITFDDPD